VRNRFGHTLGTAALALAVWAPAAGEDVDHRRHPGFVDGSAFAALATPEATTVEIALHGALLRALTTWDPELGKLAGGLQSIHAVILELGDAGQHSRGRELLLGTEKKLLERGWERITRIKEGGSDVVVLALAQGDRIQGLVVMVSSLEEQGELVFANIAGDIDLAALAELGEQMAIPGLDRLGERP
jgi:hypothetical protein